MNNTNEYFIKWFSSLVKIHKDNYLENILAEIKSLDSSLKTPLYAFFYQVKMLVNIELLYNVKSREYFNVMNKLIQYNNISEYENDIDNNDEELALLINYTISYIKRSDAEKIRMMNHANEYQFAKHIIKINPSFIVETLQYNEQLKNEYSLKNIIAFYSNENKDQNNEEKSIDYIFKKLIELKSLNQTLYMELVKEIIENYYILRKASSKIGTNDLDGTLILNKIETLETEEVIKFLEASKNHYKLIISDYLYFEKEKKILSISELYDQGLNKDEKQKINKRKKNA